MNQGENETKHFTFYHKENKDLKFELTMLRGEAKLLINTFKEFSDYKLEHNFLPKVDGDKIYSLDSKSNSTIKITKEDYDFWIRCVYLLAVISNKKGAKYILDVQTEDITVTKYGKIGVPIKDQIKKNEVTQYIFFLNKARKFRINTSLYMGKLSYFVGNKKHFDKSIKSSKDSFIEIDGKDLQKFKVGENIYVKVKGTNDRSEFVLLVTHHNSFSILPDSLP